MAIVTETLGRRQRRRAAERANRLSTTSPLALAGGTAPPIISTAAPWRPEALPARSRTVKPLSHARLSEPAYLSLVSTLEGYGNVLADDHKAALAALVGTMTEMAVGGRKGRWAFGLPTGTGKTTAIAAWCGQLAGLGQDQISVAVAASKVEALCELKREMIGQFKMSPDRIGLIHSKRYDPRIAAEHAEGKPLPEGYASEPSEGADRQIVLVTHERVRGCELSTFGTYKGSPRSLLLFDESLIASDSVGIQIKELRRSLGWLTGDRAGSMEPQPALTWLTNAVKLIEAALASDQDDTTVQLPPITLDEAAAYARNFGVNQACAAAVELLDISYEPVRVVGAAQGGAVWYKISVPVALKNILVLDASAPIRQLARLDKSVTDVEDPERGLEQVRRIGKPLGELKSFENVTIRRLNAGGGRTTMDEGFAHKRREDRKASREVVKVVEGIPRDEGVLIFCYKARSAKINFREILMNDLAAAGIDVDEMIREASRHVHGCHHHFRVCESSARTSAP